MYQIIVINSSHKLSGTHCNFEYDLMANTPNNYQNCYVRVVDCIITDNVVADTSRVQSNQIAGIVQICLDLGQQNVLAEIPNFAGCFRRELRFLDTDTDNFNMVSSKPANIAVQSVKPNGIINVTLRDYNDAVFDSTNVANVTLVLEVSFVNEQSVVNNQLKAKTKSLF